MFKDFGYYYYGYYYIFNFAVKYLNNTLATREDLHRWSLSESPSCSFSLQSETLQHIVLGCKQYVDH